MRRHVYYYTHVQAPFDGARLVLEDEPHRWLPPPAEPVDGSWEVLLTAEGALPAAVASRPVLVHVDPPAVRADMVLRALSWRAASGEQLFPVLTADLELVELNGSGCQLSLMGSYRPPLAVAGDVADKLLGHRIAEACVRRFVLDVAERVSRTCGAATGAQ